MHNEKGFRMAEAEKIEQTIRTLFLEVYSMQRPGKTAPTLSDDSILLESGLDSLGFAILVARLEEDLGFDPFSLSTEAYYPQTFREFLDFYIANQPT